MRRRTLLVAAGAALAVPHALFAQAELRRLQDGDPANSRVLDFHTDIRIAKSGELTVTERLTLEVDDRHPHSILRRSLAPDAKLVDVIRNGHPEIWVAEPQPEALALRIGGAPLDPGRHLYQIIYRAPRPRRADRGLDEFAWQLDGGDFGVERVTAEVTLPARVPARDIRAAPAKDQQSFVRDGRAAFRSTRALAPGEAMTIAIRFPHGVVAERGVSYGGILVVPLGLALAAATLWRIRILSARS